MNQEFSNKVRINGLNDPNFQENANHENMTNHSINSFKYLYNSTDNDQSMLSESGVIHCFNCASRNTPLWRRDSNGNNICNACGLYYKLHGINRPLSMRRTVIHRRQRLQSNRRQSYSSEETNRIQRYSMEQTDNNAYSKMSDVRCRYNSIGSCNMRNSAYKINEDTTDDQQLSYHYHRSSKISNDLIQNKYTQNKSSLLSSDLQHLSPIDTSPISTPSSSSSTTYSGNNNTLPHLQALMQSIKDEKKDTHAIATLIKGLLLEPDKFFEALLSRKEQIQNELKSINDMLVNLPNTMHQPSEDDHVSMDDLNTFLEYIKKNNVVIYQTNDMFN